MYVLVWLKILYAYVYVRTYVRTYGIWRKKVDVLWAYYGSTYGSNTDTNTGVFVKTYGYEYGRFCKNVRIQIRAFL